MNLTNNPNSFQDQGVIETGEKLKPNIIHYRDYRKSFNNKCHERLMVDSNGMKRFLRICISTSDEFAPQKEKYPRGNNIPFIKNYKKCFYEKNFKC